MRDGDFTAKLKAHRVFATSDGETAGRLGAVTVPGVMPKLSRTPGSIRSLGPAFGSANQQVLGGLLGLTPAEIAALRTAGVIAGG